ncbi:hypothetical protein [Streptomyces sp. NPDC056188]|uniref:hypothetical protein n=1 Tax=Streptomyces sp. NPDC056188 TaxID=3345740 RepID=UPI0035E0F4A6
MSARDKLYGYAGTPAVLPESMLDAALDAFRAEVLASDGQAYDGELAMYRELVRTLRVVVRDDRSAEKQRAEVRQLLHHHAADDAAAREDAKGKSTADSGDATPRLIGRRARLLDAIRTHGGRWDTGRVLDLYQLTEPGRIQRVTARRDLGYLQWAGHLTQRGPENNRSYTLKSRKGDA